MSGTSACVPHSPVFSPVFIAFFVAHASPPHTRYQQPRYLDRNCACTPQPGAKRRVWWRAHAFHCLIAPSPILCRDHIPNHNVLIPRFLQYGLGFYFNYLSRWPDMCCTAQHPSGRLMGYGALSLFSLSSTSEIRAGTGTAPPHSPCETLFSLLCPYCMRTTPSSRQGRRIPKRLPRPRYRSDGLTRIPASLPRSHAHELPRDGVR